MPTEKLEVEKERKIKGGDEMSIYGEGETRVPMDVTSVIERFDVRLKWQRKAAAERLADLDRIIEMIKKQPELLETLNLIRKVGI